MAYFCSFLDTFKIYSYLFYAVCLHECMHACLQRPEKGIRSPGTRLTDGGEAPYTFWEPNLWKNSKCFLTAEVSLQNQYVFFKNYVYVSCVRGHMCVLFGGQRQQSP